MLPLARLQGYLYFKAAQHHEMVSLLPFRLFFHETDPSPDSNYALVNEAGGEPLQDSLRQLQTLFT